MLVRSPLLTIATSGANLCPPVVWFADVMTSFSGVAFLFCFAVLCFVFRLYAFVEAATLRSIVLRYAGAPIAICISFFGDVDFSEYFLYHFRFLFVWRVEYVVRSLLPNGIFLPCDRGLDF